MLIEFIKDALVPGSFALFLIGVSIGAVLLYGSERSVRAGRLLLTLLTAFYVLLALPPISGRLIAGLVGDDPPILTAADAKGARVLVVLGSGVVTYTAGEAVLHPMGRWTTLSVLEGARLYRVVHPDWVIASGGIPNPASQKRAESVVIRDTLVSLGVPAERIVLESESRKTSDQITNIARILREKPIAGPILLVTAPTNYARVRLLAKGQGLTIVAAPADTFRSGPDAESPSWFKALQPSIGSLRASETAIYEYLAIVKEWSTGKL